MRCDMDGNRGSGRLTPEGTYLRAGRMVDEQDALKIYCFLALALNTQASRAFTLVGISGREKYVLQSSLLSLCQP